MKQNSIYYSIRKTRYNHPTHYLTAKQVKRIFKAAENAYCLDVPLNRFFTIHFNDYVDGKPQKFMNALMANTRKWLQRRNVNVSYIYTLENAPIKGVHAHLLIHIPAGMQVEFKKAMKRWLPFEWTRTSVDVKPVHYPPYGALNALNPIYGRLRYMCKGIHPKETVLEIKPKYQGEINARRYGISKYLR